MSIDIRAEGVDRAIQTMEEVLSALGGKNAQKAIAGALNQSLSSGRREAAREARKAYTARIKKLFDNINIRRARNGSLEGELQFTGGKGVSLIHFKAQPNFPQPPGSRPPAGVTAQIRRDESRKIRFSKRGGSKSFIMKKKQGGFGVFVRHGKTKGDLEMLLGPSPVQALQRRDIQEKIENVIEETFGDRLPLEIDRLLARSGS